LNTLRVVNAGSSKGDAVFVYDLTCKTLYYHAKYKIELKRVLKIETSKKYVDSKIPYLNKFLLLSYFIPTASISNIPIEELVDIASSKPYSCPTLTVVQFVLLTTPQLHSGAACAAASC